MEIKFRKLELEDQETIDRFFKMRQTRSCECTFANTYLWSRQYKVEFAVVEEMLVLHYISGKRRFAFPYGNKENLKKVLKLLMAWCREKGETFRLAMVTPQNFALLEELFPGQFVIEYRRDAADYVYETEKLIRLAGKKYHGKKNHINKFQKQHPDWSYEPLSEENLEECFQMALVWRRENGCERDPGKNAEMCVTLNALRLFEELKLKGGVLRAGGRIVAFTIGEAVCEDTMVVHIEKAFAQVEGAYPMINQQFLLHEASEYRYVNREDDAGQEGLRKAKLSYHPAFMVEKGTVRMKSEEEEA